MKLHNTLSRRLEDFMPLHDKTVHIYSCGPTVYDHIHIGNLSAFIAADTLRRVLAASGYKVKHVMNFTDVDDKTIARSREQYPDTEPMEALAELTNHYSEIFLSDMRAIGNDVEAATFVKATDNIAKMQAAIASLHKQGFAYIAEDGVYFSIEKYIASGKKYGQLTDISAGNTSQQRIQNDEYDKDNVHDFALWKTRKPGEPSWDFTLDGHNLPGRPGWHIECSVMSTDSLGQPFDIHTGGVDLIFPHHENEIAQSTAGKSDAVYAKYFVHNEHLLVDGHKMSKSLNNFYTLRDIIEKGFDPMAFRLMVLQSHYRSQSNFTWEALQAAQNRLVSLQTVADLRWQSQDAAGHSDFKDTLHGITKALADDLNTPQALGTLAGVVSELEQSMTLAHSQKADFIDFLDQIDKIFGLELLASQDITAEQKHLIAERETARKLAHWEKSDKLRTELRQQGLEINDTPHGPIWSRAS